MATQWRTGTLHVFDKKTNVISMYIHAFKGVNIG